MSQPIKFNSKSKEFRELSNFFIATFFLDSEKWPSVEHYFQANKFISSEAKDKIRNLETPNEAKKLGSPILYLIFFQFTNFVFYLT